MEVKICGIKTIDEAVSISKEKPDYIGIVLFFPKSKRNISINEAKELFPFIDPSIKKVAVTVSPDLDQIRQIEEAGFDILQIHGEFDTCLFSKIKLPVIKAFNEGNLESLDLYIDIESVYAFLFDAACPGSGKTFDYNSLPDLSSLSKKIMLSGGLNPSNVSLAIKSVHPDIVDVSSGVENADGNGKDLKKVHDFIANARATIV